MEKDLFIKLDKAKQDIAIVLSDRWFESDDSFYWLGEVLAIGDYFIDLDDIETALTISQSSATSFFKYLDKQKKYSYADYLLGKQGRAEKRVNSLLKSSQKLEEIKSSFFEILENYKNTSE